MRSVAHQLVLLSASLIEIDVVLSDCMLDRLVNTSSGLSLKHVASLGQLLRDKALRVSVFGLCAGSRSA